MKKSLLLLLIAVLLTPLGARAQSAMKYGKVNYDSLLTTMPEYIEAQAQLASLRQQYEQEAAYNDATFKRMFADFLQGQKDFPENILLKRQRDLQDAMEKSIAFRTSCDSLLRQAEADFRAPIAQKLDAAIYAVGMERGYECIVNTSAGSHPFLHPLLTEDATPFVLEKLRAVNP
ncbi:MAG: OmpH family outer membrane protein [Bacteroidales bacterium]|nr:OmpH family outer membrane protein [Bacteroidales bacterium]